jgi:hypothetical protein
MLLAQEFGKMRVATLCLTKDIHWLVSPSDKLTAPLKAMPGWAVLHPLTAIRPTDKMVPIPQFPTGDGRTTVSRAILQCAVPERTASGADPDTEVLETMKSLLKRLRHVSRQATFPRRDDFVFFNCYDIAELPNVEFEEPYYGQVYHPDNSFVDTALTMDLVERAGELPTTFEAPVYEGILLDAFRAVKDNDYRSALLYSALAVEAMAGELIDAEHAKLMAATPPPPHIRAVASQDERSKGGFEDPVFKWMRKSGRFAELLHELPLYVYRKSLKQDLPEVYQQARKLYQTRNSLAHRGESAMDRDLFPMDVFGAVDAMKCVREVFGWFGVPGKWSIPFENSVDEWRSR